MSNQVRTKIEKLRNLNKLEKLRSELQRKFKRKFSETWKLVKLNKSLSKIKLLIVLLNKKSYNHNLTKYLKISLEE